MSFLRFLRPTRLRMTVLTIVVLAGTIGGVAYGLQHIPEFYRRAVVPPGPRRSEQSNEFFVKAFDSFMGAFTDGKGPWSFTFTQEQLNSFFEEDFVRFGDADHFRKLGIFDPRIEFNDDELRLGFRYGNEQWNTILSYDLKIWVAKSDVNVIAIEIVRRRAGGLPIPSQQILSELTELGRRHNIDVSWWRRQGHPVAVIKFQTDRPRQTAQIQSLSIAAGSITIRGFSFDPASNPLDEPAKKSTVQVSQAP